jgi:hypothetical protein
VFSLYLVKFSFITSNFNRLDPSEDIEENRRNLIALTQKVFDAIVSSADKYETFFLPPNSVL